MLKELNNIANRYSLMILDNWTETALEFNAADVSRRRYEEVQEVVALRTTENIPQGLRLQPFEIDIIYILSELVEKYTTEIPNKIARDFLINTVSWLDAYLEDVYDLLLLQVSGEKDENRRGNLVRSGWSNNKLRNFLLDDINLQSPPARRSTLSMTLDRYEE
ncbi:MAG: hypothetical protein OWR52_09930 [Acidibacillus sp.]|nr:hypothetical protein [Acidibacillus sp.]